MKRVIYAACAAAAMALAIPVSQGFADDGPSATHQEQWRQSREERNERRAEILDARLVGFKASLALTGDQVKAWAPFETALRDAAKPRGPAPGPDADEARDQAPPSPIDRMRDISKRMGERSSALSSLADAAQPLYAGLDAKQKVVFDATLMSFMRPHRFGPDGHRGPGGPGWGGPERD